MINVFFRESEAYGVFLVSVCSPVNLSLAMDRSIITVTQDSGATAELPASHCRGGCSIYSYVGLSNYF